MATLIAMHGLPRSGKSTIARELSRQYGAPIVSKDNIRLALHGSVYAGNAEPMVRAISKIMIDALFRSGHEWVIADETHYSRAARDFVRDCPKDNKWITYFYDVPTGPTTCIQRAIDTEQLWLPPVIKEMVERHEPLAKDEPQIGSWSGMIGEPAETELPDCMHCGKFSMGEPECEGCRLKMLYGD